MLTLPVPLLGVLVGLAGVALGLLALLVARLVLVRRDLAELVVARDARENELQAAHLRLARAAERDHELRNGLAGLAGAMALLGEDGTGTTTLGRVVDSELSRLDDLLRSLTEPRPRTPTIYALAPVLEGQVMLRRSAGVDLELETVPDLQVVGSPDTLAQVVVNLLDNAERHAPGSPVRIRAERRADRVLIVVRDHGGGLTPGHERAVSDAGVRCSAGEGRGLGLAICRRILEAEDGTIAILPREREQRGCVVAVELPAAPAPAPSVEPQAPQRGGSPQCLAS